MKLRNHFPTHTSKRNPQRHNRFFTWILQSNNELSSGSGNKEIFFSIKLKYIQISLGRILAQRGDIVNLYKYGASYTIYLVN